GYYPAGKGSSTEGNLSGIARLAASAYCSRQGDQMFENAFNNIDRAMRNDEGLASELDYAEQTSWLLFLKYLDDLEQERRDESKLEGTDYAPILNPAYRWSNWAAPKGKDGKLDHDKARTGPDLIDFVNGELFPYLKSFNLSAEDADTI